MIFGADNNNNDDNNDDNNYDDNNNDGCGADERNIFFSIISASVNRCGRKSAV